MGLMPVGEKQRLGRRRLGEAGPDSVIDVTPIIKIQAAFMLLGSIVGLLGIILPHPEAFRVPELLAINLSSIAVAIVFWFAAPSIPESVARITPAVGTVAITVAVIFSRDPTSAYAMLYLFPGIYAYYFLRPVDAAWHITFAVANYLAAIAILGTVGTSVSTGSIVHHVVITAGTLVVVGTMLVYLRRRVERLMTEIVASARTDMQTGLLNAAGIAERVSSELERTRMSAGRMTFMTLTVRGTRDVGSKRGHGFVAALTSDVGTLLDDSTRRIDVIGRTGPQEFSLILVDTDESTAFLLAEQILARLRRAFREREVSLACSIGIATFPKHAATAEALEQAASAASEAASALGSDRAVIYSPELDDVLAGDPSRELNERRTHLSTVLSLAEVLDLRDARTAAHSLSVARSAELIGRDFGLPEARIQRLRLAAMLHDIGKVGIPDSVFAKPGPLSPAEWDQVRKHPELAARILGARELTDIREWILARHEQPDGHGYPRGLSGDAIPLESRILAVAEAYDAMTNERPFRSARSHEEAVAELGRYAGAQFDGRVVDSLVRVLADASLAHAD